jgi:hypothetical protein
VRVVASGASADGNRSVEKLPFKLGRVMATETEIILILTHIQEVTVTAAVRFVAGKAIAFLYRRMHIFFLPLGVMALATEFCPLGRQFETIPPFDRMFLELLLVA